MFSTGLNQPPVMKSLHRHADSRPHYSHKFLFEVCFLEPKVSPNQIETRIAALDNGPNTGRVYGRCDASPRSVKPTESGGGGFEGLNAFRDSPVTTEPPAR